MTAAERGVLLLCCALGDPEAKPLSTAQFRELSKRGQAVGPGGGQPLESVRASELARLGYGRQAAERIVSLLEREEQLDRYLGMAEKHGITPVTRISVAYPAPIARKRGPSCPPVLFCAGKLNLFSSPCVGLAGSRKPRDINAAFARSAGILAARESLTLVTGGAEGADRIAAEACLEAGGSVILFLPDQLTRHLDLAGERCLAVSEDGFDLPFSAARALSRNALIYMMGDKTLIAQAEYGAGGTWAGAVENLKNGWSELYVCADDSRGGKALVERGAAEVRKLTSITALQPNQGSFLH